MAYERIKLVEEVAEEVGGSVRYDYSGRSMYGKECVGIVVGYPDEVSRLAADKGLPHPQLDNMGLDYILYWPSIQTYKIIEDEPVEVAPEVEAENVTEQEEVEDAPVINLTNLTEKQGLVLRAIHDNGFNLSGFTVKELAEYTGDMGSRSVTGVVSSLKKRGILVKVDTHWELSLAMR